MNRDKIERWILLKSTGELGRWQTWRLERLLANDPEARAFEADTARLAQAARAWSVAQPGPHTAQSIHARLHTESDRRDTLVFAPARTHGWWPVFAAAAAILLVGAGLWLRMSGTPHPEQAAERTVEALAWDDGVDAELDALQDWLVASTAEESARTVTVADEDQLIRELLALEGITI